MIFDDILSMDMYTQTETFRSNEMSRPIPMDEGGTLSVWREKNATISIPEKSSNQEEINTGHKISSSSTQSDDFASMLIKFSVDTMTRMKTAFHTMWIEMNCLEKETGELRQQISRKERAIEELRATINNLTEKIQKENISNEELTATNKSKDERIAMLLKRIGLLKAKRSQYYISRQRARDSIQSKWVKDTAERLAKLSDKPGGHVSKKKTNNTERGLTVLTRNVDNDQERVLQKDKELKDLQEKIIQKDKELEDLHREILEKDKEMRQKQEDLKNQLDKLIDEKNQSQEKDTMRKCYADNGNSTLNENSMDQSPYGNSEVVSEKRRIAAEALTTLNQPVVTDNTDNDPKIFKIIQVPSVSRTEPKEKDPSVRQPETIIYREHPEITFTDGPITGSLQRVNEKEKRLKRSVKIGYFRWTRERNIQLIDALIDTLRESDYSTEYRIKESVFLGRVTERCAHLGVELNIRDNVNNLLRRHMVSHNLKTSIAEIKSDPAQYMKILEVIKKSLVNSPTESPTEKSFSKPYVEANTSPFKMEI